GRGLLVRVDAAGAEAAPAPRPDGRDTGVLGDLARREPLPLHDLEPRAPLEALPAALPAVGLEAEHDPELRLRDPELREVRERAAEGVAQQPRPEDRPLLPDLRRREVVLADDVRDLRDLPPPVSGRTIGVGGRVDEQERPCAALGEPL